MKSSMVKLIVLCCLLLGNLALAVDDPNYSYANSEPEQMPQGMSQMSSSVNLPFDPNDYDFLIYDCGGDTSENEIQAAMQKLGLEYTLCNSSNPVTSNLLHTHDILIVGWAAGGNKSGLDPSIIEEGITGRVILSGHDSDYHTVNVEPEDAATTFFIQEIDYVLKGVSTGLIVCADIDSNFDWLPDSWEIESTTNGGSTITEFTQDGLDSGIFDNLTPALMSGWSTSFHNNFTSWGDGFKLFELGQGDVAVTIAAPINPNGFDFVKKDGLDDETECAIPDDQVTYTVCFNNITDWTFYDTYIVDFLPDEVNYPAGEDTYVFDGNSIQFVAGDPGYNDEEHYYIWEIGTIAPNDANCVSLTVTMNQKAEPGMLVHNIAELRGTIYDPNPTEILIALAAEDTRVCCWTDDPNIYVDASATGTDTGMSWENAYTDLADAIRRATDAGCAASYIINVAQGTYSPVESSEDGFILPEGVSVYGGFPSGGGEFANRNPKKYKTVLTGLIDEQTLASMVVKMGDKTLLDGVIVTNSFDYNVYGSGVDFTLSHCTITESYFGYGIYAENGDVAVQWCTVNSNSSDGIRHEGQGYSLTVNNSWILRNGQYGIRTTNSTLDLRNSIVSESDLMVQGRAGIHMVNPTYSPTLHNNTVANNKAEGIFFTDDGNVSGDPNYPDYPDLQNSIVYFNNPGGQQLAGLNPDAVANFCCIQDCNEPGTTNYNDEPGFAYAIDPNGTPDPNNYHLAHDSFCVDKANPYLSYTGQVDLDGEGVDRKYGDYVDIGADEVYDCDDDYLSEIDVHNDLDWDADGLVNMVEFSKFSVAWLTYDPNHPYCDPNNPNYVGDPNAPGYIDEEDKLRFNPVCDLDNDLHVGLSDIITFTDDWLWVACWKLEEINQAMAMQSQTAMFEPMAVENSMSFVAMEAPVFESSAMVEEMEEEYEVSAETLIEIIGFLDEVAATETDNVEGIEQMRAILQKELEAVLNDEKQ